MVPLFGSPLITALARSSYTTPTGLSVPGVLARIYQEIESEGLEMEGLFRKSGSTATVNALQQQLEETSNPFLVKFPDPVSAHSLAGLFKRYLQQLPEPVIPRAFQPQFLDLFDREKCTEETLKRRLKEICKTLPHEHLHLLQYLMEVCDAVQLHQQNNHMSVESLAIIFAPTCVRIDGVTTLMPSASSTLPQQPTYTSHTSLPATLNKQQVMFKRAKRVLVRLRKKHKLENEPSLLYKPNDLMQLELVKESNTWIRIFEFMMSYPEVFTTLTNTMKREKYQDRLISTVKVAVPELPAAKEKAEIEEPESPKEDTESLREPQWMDFSSLEFTADDLTKTFSKFEVDFDYILQRNKKPKPSISIVTKPATTKYVKTLQNWKSREEQNPNVIIPNNVKRPPLNSPSDWVKALSTSGAFLAEEKNITYPVHRNTAATIKY